MTATAMKHQAQSLKFCAPRAEVADFSDCGTGKTFVQIMDYAARRKKRGTGPMLVVAPKSLLENAWAADIRKFAPHLKVSIARATNRADAFAITADVYITNTDAAGWLAEQKPAWWKKKFAGGTLVIDESTKFKHATSARSKAIAKVAKHFTYRRILTGTPTSNGVCDLWHQMFVLDGGKRLGKSFYQFRGQVCTPTQVGPSAQMVQWTDKDGAELAVASLISDCTIRHKLEECVDIPANHIYSRDYLLSDKQMKAYEQMANDAILELGEEDVISAVNAAVVAGKLLQIASGALYDNAGGHKLLDTGRYELVVDLAEEHPDPVIIWFNWGHQRDAILKELVARKITHCTYDGKTPSGERDENAKLFQAGYYKVMLAHPASAGHGLTWTRATRAVWASPTYDLELWKQANHRHYRNGQKKKTETIMVIAPGTIDEKAYERCMGKLKRLTDLLTIVEAV